MKNLLILILALGIAFLVYDRTKLQAELATTQTRLDEVGTQLQQAQAAAARAAASGNPRANAGTAPAAPQTTRPAWMDEHLEKSRDLNR